MRSISAILGCAFVLFAPSVASADSRVFIIANQADGYGVDQCLAKGDKCGAHAARSYCRSRDFADASSYRRVDPDEITGSVPKAGRQLQSCRLQRIRGHHLPALMRSRFPASDRPPHRRPGNDVTLPREAAMGWPRGRGRFGPARNLS